MKNYYKSMLENFTSFYMNNDDIVPIAKYGIAPPTYMSTEPRFDKRPNDQSTPGSDQNSSMGPNPQAGTELVGNPRERQPEYSPSYIGGLGDSEKDDSFYRQDPRIKQANSEVKIYGLGYPVVPQTGVESIIDIISGPYDRDPGEVNTPIVYGTSRAYQGSAEQFTNSPPQELGGSAFGPRESNYIVKDDLDDDNAHPNQMWIQPHPNAVAHTVGHDHPFKHEDKHYKPVEYATSIGDRGVR